MSPTPADLPQPKQSSGGSFRWVILALVFFATTVNYVDRAVLGVLEPELRSAEAGGIGWTATQYGYINGAFTAAYAIGFLVAGWMIDRLGTRFGYAIALIVWSIAAAGHALATNVWQFGIARFALGLGESGNFPAAIKTVAEWFPKKERALATGIFNSGTNIGAILAPIVVPALVVVWHWQAAFIVTGLAGLIWVFFWWPIYRQPEEHPRVSPQELAYIQSDPADPPAKIAWLRLFPYRQTWAFFLGKFLTDAIWWFYLFWFGPFMFDQFGVNIKSIGMPMIIVYTLASVGSIAGGWLSSWLLGRGWNENWARKVAMLTCAVCIIPVAFAPLVSNKWLAVVLIGIAAASHQGFSANLFTLVSDMFPRKAVSSVVGIGGFAGAIGGLIMNVSTGWLKEWTGNYIAMFAVASAVYIVALAIIHSLVPRLEPVVMNDE
jgi:MFS transporter, ACS family, hexuronate transporter